MTHFIEGDDSVVQQISLDFVQNISNFKRIQEQ